MCIYPSFNSLIQQRDVTARVHARHSARELARVPRQPLDGVSVGSQVVRLHLQQRGKQHGTVGFLFKKELFRSGVSAERLIQQALWCLSPRD